MQKLLDAGISTRRGVMTSHRETAYKEYSQGLRLAISEDASDRSIIIPLYVPMDETEMEYVIRNMTINLE
jgi:dTDP-4-amino-4,6-dideoxygalactose transaminase